MRKMQRNLPRGGGKKQQTVVQNCGSTSSTSDRSPLFMLDFKLFANHATNPPITRKLAAWQHVPNIAACMQAGCFAARMKTF